MTLGWDVLQHLRYSLGINPCDYDVIPKPK